MIDATKIRTVARTLTGAVVVVVVALTIVGAGQPADVAMTRAAAVESVEVEIVAASASEPVTLSPLAAPTPTTTPPPAPPAPAPPTTVPPTPAPAPQPVAAPTSAPSDKAPAATTFTRDTTCEANMVRWGNEARAANGLPALATDNGIQWIPVDWSDQMARAQHLSHNPDYANRIFAARPQAMTAGENVGRTTGDDRLVFDEFMNSPGHRAKILGSENTHTTAGCVRDNGGQLWVTVNFWG